MTSYDQQYQVENNLFGSPYTEFEEFVKQHAKRGGTAVDLGCGQGRDALMLARYGYAVIGVDTSHVGIAQMLERARKGDLAVKGVVADIYEYELHDKYDAVVLDSILHFEKADKSKELALLNTLVNHLNENGFLFLFVHKSPKKEREVKRWFETVEAAFEVAEESYIDYLYKETATGFQSAFQYYMLILKRIHSA
ncbi:MAG: class I SAM-dependent methyltransferase [Ardenticatenaceae bacterium]|nr:class I SAM-dependent methyltransferase [Ardenticatenaceae bacterium]